MRLLSLEALHFGKLEHFTLEPKDGLNIYRHPNEFGKTTLIYFIYYMFYGYDAKLLKGYLPWNGADPAGSLTFEEKGRQWRIERRRPAKGAEKRRVFCLTTGEELQLSAREQPGPYFLKLDGETFLRTFCITQGNLLFARTDGLDVALKNMAATGDENVSFKLAEDFLNKEHTKYMYRGKNQGPLLERKEALAEARRALQALTPQIEQQLQVRRQWEELEEAIPAAGKKLEEQKLLLKKAEGSDALKLLRQLDAIKQQKPPAPPKVTKQQLDAWEQSYSAKEQAAEELRKAEEEKNRLSDQLRLLGENAAQFGFHALSGQDMERLQKQPGRGAAVAGICLLLFGAAAVIGGVLQNPLFYLAAMGLLGGACLLLFPKAARRRVCHTYGAANVRQLLEKWQKYQQVLAQQAQCKNDLDAASQAAAAQKETFAAAEEQLEQLRRTTRLLSPEEVRQERVNWGVYEAGLTQNPAALQEQALLNGRSRAELEALAAGAEPIEETAPRARQLLSRAEEEYRALLTRRDALDPRALERLWQEQAALQAQIKETAAAVREGEEQLAAVQKSLCWLKDANEEMNTRFAPRLCTLAGEALSRLTAGKYQQLLMDMQYGISLKTSEGTYPLERFSAGTRDAVYFAFRLAVSRLLSDTALPMVLDDPFTNLDETRRAAAEKLLENAAAERQILYFTCRD